MIFFYHLTNRKIMSQKAPNGDATGASKEQCMICQKTISDLLSCCGYPLCKSCFEGITQLRDDKKKPPICPNCQKPITALIPIVPILQQDGDATGASEDEIKRIQAEKLAEKRAEIAARVAKAREDQADQAAQAELMEQFVSMFVQGAKSVTQKFEEIGKNPQKVPKGTQGAILCAFRNLLKKPWESPEKFCQEFGQTFKDFQSEFAGGSGPWQNLVGCCDFQATHLLAIKEWYDTLPKGTVLLEHFYFCFAKLKIVAIRNSQSEFIWTLLLEKGCLRLVSRCLAFLLYATTLNHRNPRLSLTCRLWTESNFSSHTLPPIPKLRLL